MNKNNQAPIAKTIPHELTVHNHTRLDPYFWLNDREKEEVLDYLQAEKKYYQEETKHTLPFQEVLFTEMKSRIKEDDSSVPYFYNGYYYITRFEQGRDYPIHARKKG